MDDTQWVTENSEQQRDLTGPELDLTQRLAIIGGHPLFMHLPQPALAELAKAMFEKWYKPGEIIVAQGDLIDAVYFIAQGSAEVIRKMTLQDKTENVFLASLHVNDAIGLSEQGFFAPGGIRTATVTATAKSLLLGITIQDFNRFLQSHAGVGHSTQAAAELMMRMNFIKDITSFVQLSLGRIRWLAQHLEKISVAKGSIIFKQGDKGDKCYLVYSGKVDIIFTDNDGQENVLASLEPPMLFGETAMLTDMPRNASARAAEECVLLAIKREHLLELTSLEKSSLQAIRSLMVERSRPVPVAHIVSYHHKTADDQDIFTLKNPQNNHYYRLTQEGWFIWQQINGKNSLRVIKQAFHNNFPKNETELVPHAIINLANAGFIEMASLNLQYDETKPPFWVTAKSTWFIMLLAILISGLVFLGVFYYQPNKNNLPKLAVAPVVNMVMGIDINNVGAITSKNVRRGLIPILAIHESSDNTNHQADLFSFINQFGQLVLFDSDKNGRIDSTDPIYSRLELIFIDKNGQITKRTSIADAGISAIIINKAELIRLAIKNQPQQFNDVENAIVMVSGSMRQVRVISLNP